jgi:hypothetical protein
MANIECIHEEDVLTAVGTGRWPDRADAELRAHVAQCDVCRDLVAVTAAFHDQDAADQRVLPDASLIWWRSQIRAREEAARTAARPITVAQALSFASVIGVLGLIVGATSSWMQVGMVWAGRMLAWLDPRKITVPESVVTLAADHALLIGLAGVAVLMLPVGLYFAIRDPRG